MSCQQEIVCDSPPGQVLPFDANSDIAGLGVLLAFSITAGITTIVLNVQSWIGNDFLHDHAPNSYDRELRDFVRRLWNKVSRRTDRTGTGHVKDHQHLRAALQKLAIALNDQQLVTGAAILIVGLVQHCSITQYHFFIVYNLSWLSYQNVEASIRVIGANGSSISLRYWRALWMLCLFASLVASTVLVADTSFMMQSEGQIAFGANTQCIWNRLNTGTAQFGDTDGIGRLFALIPITWSLISALNSMFGFGSTSLGPAMYRPLIDKIVARHIVYQHGKQEVKESIFHVILLLVVMFREFFESELLLVIRVFSVLASILPTLFRYRALAKGNGLVGSEDDWGFGQVLPVLLLSLLIQPIIELFFTETPSIGLKRTKSLPNVRSVTGRSSAVKNGVGTNNPEDPSPDLTSFNLARRPTTLVEEGRHGSPLPRDMRSKERLPDVVIASRGLIISRKQYRVWVLYSALLLVFSGPIAAIYAALNS